MIASEEYSAAFKIAVEIANHQFGSSAHSITRAMIEFAKAERERAVASALNILDEEGWLGDARTRIARLEMLDATEAK